MNFIDQLAQRLSILRGHVDNTEVAYINAPVEDLSILAKTIMKAYGLKGKAQEAGEFHITLAIFPDFPDVAISKFMELSLPIRFNVKATKLATFRDAPSKPLLLLIDPDPALLRIQSDIYNAGIKMGLQLPDLDHFSAGKYTPHVTLALDIEGLPEEFSPINPVKLSIDRFVVQREGYDQIVEINLPGSIKDRPFITVRSSVQVRHGKHVGQKGRKGAKGGSAPGFEHGTGSRPSWAGNKTATEGGHLLRNGKFELTKDRWAIDEDGKMIGAWQDTPGEAVRQFEEDQREGTKIRKQSAKEAAALDKIVSGDLSKETIQAWSGRRLNMRQTYAIGWIRELGIRWTDAKKIVESSPSAGVDSGGGRLINIQEALALALDFLNQGNIERIAPRTLEVTEEEFVAMLRGEMVVHGATRRVLTFEDGPFAIRHGKHIDQEGEAGRRGGSQTGFKHEPGSVGSGAGIKPSGQIDGLSTPLQDYADRLFADGPRVQTFGFAAVGDREEYEYKSFKTGAERLRETMEFWDFEEGQEFLEWYEDENGEKQQLFITENEASQLLVTLEAEEAARQSKIDTQFVVPNTYKDLIAQFDLPEDIDWETATREESRAWSHEAKKEFLADAMAQLENSDLEVYEITKEEFWNMGDFEEIDRNGDRNVVNAVDLLERARKEAWEFAVLKAVTAGEVEPEVANGMGALNSRGPNEHQGFKPLPDVLYHVTTSATSIKETGIQSRFELAMTNGAGLGGGDDKTISLTDSREVAKAIDLGLQEVNAIMNSKLKINDLIRMATNGETNSGVPYMKDVLAMVAGDDADDWEIGDPFPERMQETIRKINDPAVGVFGAPDGASDEVTEQYRTLEFYRSRFVSGRQLAGGPIDPLFFGTDYEALRALDPNDFTVLEYKPNENSKGQAFLGQLREWRIVGGDILELTSEFDPVKEEDVVKRAEEIQVVAMPGAVSVPHSMISDKGLEEIILEDEQRFAGYLKDAESRTEKESEDAEIEAGPEPEEGPKELPLVADTPQGRKAAGLKVPVGLDEPPIEEGEDAIKRHGKHIDQEGRKGEGKGGSKTGFKHEPGSVGGGNGANDRVPKEGEKPIRETREEIEFTEGEQEEAHQWAIENFLAKEEFDEDSIESLEIYKNNFSVYRSLNKAFRGKGEFVFENNKTLANLRDTIDDAMEGSTLQEDVVVYRGVSSDLVEKLINQGGSFNDPAYVSTSLTTFDAKDFASQKERPAIMRITVPKGIGALYMENFSILGVNEEEILLDRGLNFEFVPGTARAEGGFSIWDLRVVGKDNEMAVERNRKYINLTGVSRTVISRQEGREQDSRDGKFIWTNDELLVEEKELPLVADTPQVRKAAGLKVPIGLDESPIDEEAIERGRPKPPKPKTIYADKKKEYPDYFKGQERLGAAAFGTQVFTPFLEGHIDNFKGSRQSAAREAFHRVVGAQKENNSSVHGFALSNHGNLVGVGSLNFKPEDSPADGDFIDIETLVTTEPGNTQNAMEKLINQAASEKRGISMNAADGSKDFLSSIGMRQDGKGTFFLTPEDIEGLANELKGPKTGQFIAPSSKPKIRQRFGRLFEEADVTMPIDNRPPPIPRESQDFSQRDKWERFNWDAFQDPEVIWNPEDQMAGMFEDNQNALFQDEIDEDAERGKSEILGKIKDGGSSSMAFGRLGQSVAELFGGKPRDMKSFMKKPEHYEREYGPDVVWPDGKIEDEEGANERLSDFAHQAEGVRDEDSMGSWPDSAEYIYNRTQSALKDVGFETSDKVRLYRGIRSGSLPEDHDGGYVKLNLGSISSWTFNRSTAAHVATRGGRGALLRVDVPISRIFSMWATGPGSREAMEYLILGQDGIRAWATKISRK